MKKIAVSDITLREYGKKDGHVLSFREKVEMAKLMDKLNYETIELPMIANEKTDTLLIKTIAAALKSSALVCRVGDTTESIDLAWNALKGAKRPVLQVAIPTSIVQMEYFCHKKPPMVLEMIQTLVKKCKEYTQDVEFVALDAPRSEEDFLYQAIAIAIESGATKITLCDSAGNMLPDEFERFIATTYTAVPQLKEVELAVEINNQLNLADACAFSAIKAGATDIKTVVKGKEFGTVEGITALINVKGALIDASCEIKHTELKRVVNQLTWLMESRRENATIDLADDEKSAILFDKNDNKEAIAKAVLQMGYDLSDEDMESVYQAFKNIALKKESIGVKELEAIVASTALQVPATYVLDSYVINSGNIITATANIQMTKKGNVLHGICVGDGPIDAAFLAIEQITGQHYELDDFQIQAVTEGREAMGYALVKLRAANGKVYAGNGISTDIVGASIMAYVSAVNKIAYEEEDK